MEVLELNDANCKTYALVSGGHLALVDPVRERIERYRRTVRERNLTLKFVIETHTHADHLMINRALKKSLGAPLVMHRESPNPLVDQHVSDGEALSLGSEQIQFLHTPGHTPDSMCLRPSGWNKNFTENGSASCSPFGTIVKEPSPFSSIRAPEIVSRGNSSLRSRAARS